MNAVWDMAMGMSRLLHYLAVVGYVARGSEVWGNNYLKLLDYVEIETQGKLSPL